MVPAQVMQRVFQLKHGGATGTCFALDVDNRQYLCTARHCMQSFAGGAIELFQDNQWKTLNVRLVGFGSHGSDVCVLYPRIRLVHSALSLPASPEGFFYGQEGFFLGFPFGMRMDSKNMNMSFPFPFVKRATVSAFNPSHDPGESVLFLDGHNNPGFSGGPVVFNQNPPAQDTWCVVAIVSGYRFDRAPVLNDLNAPTDQWVAINTGIVLAYNISHALDAIKEFSRK